MSTKPILFNQEMVKAILEGRKTVTRRLVKEKIVKGFKYKCDGTPWFYINEKENCWEVEDVAPYHVGDILYVRETWCELCRVDENHTTHYDQSKYYYKTDGDYQIDLYDDNGFYLDEQKMKWHPNIHMPKVAARIFLRVKAIRAEKLGDMSIQNMINEGINTDGIITNQGPIEYRVINRFEELWNSTIKKSELDKYGFSASPWVWVIEFERTSKENTDEESND